MEHRLDRCRVSFHPCIHICIGCRRACGWRHLVADDSQCAWLHRRGTSWTQSSIRSDGVRRRGRLLLFEHSRDGIERQHPCGKRPHHHDHAGTESELARHIARTVRRPARALLVGLRDGRLGGRPGHGASTTTMVPQDPFSGGCGPQFGGNFFCSAGSSSKTLLGWTAGGGLEALVGGPWTAKAEYLYYDLGSRSYTAVETGDPASFGTPVLQASAQFRGHVARVGLNYRLGQ
jgi:hypothetical protein